MEIPIISNSIVVSLFDDVEKNLDGYTKGFSDTFYRDNIKRSLSNTEVPDDLAQKLITGKDKSEGELDTKNSIVIYRELKGLTAYQARDERIWCALSHQFFREYALFRHIDRGKKEPIETKIRRHFFTRAKRRGVDSANVASRLWWNAYIVDRCCEDHDFEELVNVLCEKTDIRMQTVERPGIFQIPQVMLAVLLVAQKNEYNRDLFRAWIKIINASGGRNMYATMNSNEIFRLFEDYYNLVKTTK